MPINSISFIQEAERIVASGSNDEATHRNVVGRAYYGVYHCALGLADSLLTPPLSACGGGSHKKVSDYYKTTMAGNRERVVKFRKVGINLLQMHSRRVTADYKLDDTISAEDAESVLITSKAIIAELVGLGAVARVS
ncbi:hypothetical protein ACF8MH_02740 [Pseudomonas sp. YQ_13]|uniref:hypothetical protein n=1 Tax=Pseudomonas sp. YQ_13 TaxID=3367235 RepID=UPI00370CA502